jgi:hypothetical protein
MPAPSRPPSSRLAAVAATALAALLAGCASTPPPPAPPAAPAPDPMALLAEVRAQQDGNDGVEVRPWREPAVEDLVALAEGHERAGAWRQASEAMARAIAISPEDPDLLQRQAELALARAAWPDAERYAAASFERGPRLGPLCRRNWTTIRLAREARGEAADGGELAERAARCTLEPPVRM